MSPVHVVDWEQVGNIKRARGITEVFAVDLVLDPATTSTLFESREYRPAAETLASRIELAQARLAEVEARNADLERGGRLLREHLRACRRDAGSTARRDRHDRRDPGGGNGLGRA